jgi:hypothetical protein
VQDDQYRNATYYLVGRNVGTTFFGEFRIQFLVPNGTGSKSACFNHVDLSIGYEVLLTKIDRDDLNPSNTLYSVNTLTLNDSKYNMRTYVEQHSIQNDAPQTYGHGEAPYLMFSSHFKDPGRTIDAVHVVLFDPLNKASLEAQVINITESHYDGDILKLDHLRFDGVSPKVKYLIQIFADGNDGVDDFEQITIGHYTYESGSYDISTVNTSHHGLFAAVTGLEVIGEDVYIYYAFENSDDITYSDTKEPITMIMTTFTGKYPNRVEETFLLDTTKDHFVLPLSLVKDGLYLSIRDSRFKFSFCDFVISPNYVEIISYPSSNKQLMINIIDFDNDLPISIKIEIVDEHLNVLETIENIRIEFGNATYEYTGNYDPSGNYSVLITYQVDSLIGVLTHTTLYPLYG